MKKTSWKTTDAMKLVIRRATELAVSKMDTQELLEDLENARPRVRMIWETLEKWVALVEEPRHKALMQNGIRLGCWTWAYDRAYRDQLDAAVDDLLSQAGSILSEPERVMAPDSWHINKVREAKRFREVLDEQGRP